MPLLILTLSLASFNSPSFSSHSLSSFNSPSFSPFLPLSPSSSSTPARLTFKSRHVEVAHVELGEGDLHDVPVTPAYGPEGEHALEARVEGVGGPEEDERVGGRRRWGETRARSWWGGDLQLVRVVDITIIRTVAHCGETKGGGGERGGGRGD